MHRGGTYHGTGGQGTKPQRGSAGLKARGAHSFLERTDEAGARTVRDSAPRLLATPTRRTHRDALPLIFHCTRRSGRGSAAEEPCHGKSAPAGPDRPGARVISNIVCRQNGLLDNERGVSDMVWQPVAGPHTRHVECAERETATTSDAPPHRAVQCDGAEGRPLKPRRLVAKLRVMPRGWCLFLLTRPTWALAGILAACSTRPAQPPAASSSAVNVPAPAPTSAEPAAAAPLAATEPPIPVAPPHPLMRALLAPFQRAARDGARPENVSIDEAACRPLVPRHTGAIEHCAVELLANGTAPALAVVSDCGEHTCTVVYYVWHETDRDPYRFDPPGLVTLEVSPDHRYLLVGELGYSEESPFVPDHALTRRLEFETGARNTVADCLSPRLSPKNRWYLCRNLRGDVLKFPAEFGPTTLVVHASLPPGDEVKLGGPFEDFPAPVEFIAPGRVRYSLYLRNREEVVEQEAPFVE